jgi:hypothetical protein
MTAFWQVNSPYRGILDEQIKEVQVKKAVG